MAPPPASPPEADELGRRIAAQAGLDRLDPGRSLRPRPERAGTDVVTIYRLGEHVLVWSDPARVDDCARLLAGVPDTLDGGAVHDELALSGVDLGTNHLHLLAGPGPIDPGAPDGLERRELRREDPADVALVAELLAATPDDDADEAELDVDDLDPLLVGLIDGGVLVAEAGWRPFDLADRFADIGVLVRPSARGRGLAPVVVAAACAAAIRDGRAPLYRCDVTNPGSLATARRVGFVAVATVSAVRLG